MIHYAMLDATGVYPHTAGRGVALPKGALETPGDLLPAQIIRMMLDDGVWVPRPEVPPMAVTPPLVTCEGLPTGSTVTVSDGETGEVLATLTDPISLELPDPGPYQIEVTPPLPWLPLSQRVIVP